MKGPGLIHLAKMKKVHTLILAHTPIDDAGLAFLPDLPGRRTVNLGNTKITNAGLKTLSRFPLVCRVVPRQHPGFGHGPRAPGRYEKSETAGFF